MVARSRSSKTSITNGVGITLVGGHAVMQRVLAAIPKSTELNLSQVPTATGDTGVALIVTPATAEAIVELIEAHTHPRVTGLRD